MRISKNEDIRIEREHGILKNLFPIFRVRSSSQFMIHRSYSKMQSHKKAMAIIHKANLGDSHT